MSAALADVLGLLERLVAFDTQNPPRRIVSGDEGIFGFVRAALGSSFAMTTRDLGEGCVSLLAVRGAPTTVFNVHLDTVPFGEGWTRDPLRLVVEGERAIGRGAADVKGAAACMIDAAARTKGDAALLFTSDEEAGSSRCIRTFLAEPHPFRAAVIAEPTNNLAVVEHRGIATVTGRFSGTPGHASAARALEDSALHEAVRWGARALAFAESHEQRAYKSLAGVRFNLGVVEGGTKANMIAGAATVRFGLRPLPDQDPAALARAVTDLAPRAERVAWELGFVAPSLPGAGSPAAAAEALAASLGLELGPPVDFWTEAALFSEANIPSVVYGPGDIRQAHTTGEWVSIAALAQASATYAKIFDRP